MRKEFITNSNNDDTKEDMLDNENNSLSMHICSLIVHSYISYILLHQIVRYDLPNLHSTTISIFSPAHQRQILHCEQRAIRHYRFLSYRTGLIRARRYMRYKLSISPGVKRFSNIIMVGLFLYINLNGKKQINNDRYPEDFISSPAISSDQSVKTNLNERSLNNGY